MHKLAVVDNLLELRIAGFPACGIKAGRSKPDVIILPLAWPSTGIDAGRRAAEALVALVHLRVDATAIPVFQRSGIAVAVEDLHLIQTVQVDTGIRVLGDHELEV